jgi:UDP-glucuronate 4-epimerase
VRALVTGCAGFIGSHLIESLLEEGHAVVGVDCLTDNYEQGQKLRNIENASDWDDFEFVRADLAEDDISDRAHGCEVVFHLAGEPGVRGSWGQGFPRYLRNNVLATQRLLELAKAEQPTRLIFASSSSIYGDAERFPTPESATPRPVSPYGVTKLASEYLCQTYSRNFGIEAISLRYFSVYGPRQRPDMAFHRFCRAAVEGHPIVVYGDGAQTRDFTFVADAVAATKAAARTERTEADVFNIGGGAQVSVARAIEIISELSGCSIEVRHKAPPPGDARDTGADTSRARDELGYRPSTPLNSGLSAEFEWIAETIPAERARR